MKDTNHYDNPPKKKSIPDNRQENAEGARKSRRQNRGGGDVADWSNADAEKLKRAVVKITARGCAIQLSYTKDGGSLVTRIVGDGEPYNEYVRPTESLDDYLDGLALDFE